MTAYRTLLEEIQTGSSQDPVRKGLLAPQAADPHKDWEQNLPRKKRFVGPGPWYEVVENGNGAQRK